MPKKYSGMDVGGVEFQFSATELKMINKYVTELKKVQTLRQGIVLTYKRQQELAKKDLDAGKQDTKAAQERKKVLTDIVKIMNDTRTFRQALMKTIPKIEEKAVKEGKKHASVLDLLKKKYAWQLLYFTALATVIAMTLGGSKVLAHFFDVIGSALGFILDMLLIALIPYVVTLVKWLFKIGSWFSGLPDSLKIASLLLIAFFGTAGALIFYGILKDIVARIIKIGVEAAASSTALDTLFGKKPPVVTPAPVPGEPGAPTAGGVGSARSGIPFVLGAGGMLLADMITRWITTGKLRFTTPTDIYERGQASARSLESLGVPNQTQQQDWWNKNMMPTINIFLDGINIQRTDAIKVNLTQGV